MRNFVQIYNRLERIHQKINMANTGTAKELAYSLNISERAVYNHFKILKAFGLKVYFSYSENSYIYSNTPIEIKTFKRREQNIRQKQIAI